MKYLDYLATHNWEDLPEAVRRSIAREEYNERRELVQALEGGAPDVLPPALAAAFTERTDEQQHRAEGAGTQGAKVRMIGNGRLYWLLAAAGWLLFAVTAAALLLRAPQTTTVYRVIAADVPPPEVVVRVDTVRETIVETAVRYRTVYDTVFVNQPTVRLVSVTDTLYVPMPLTSAPDQLVSGSRSLAGREGVTRFLFATE